MQKLIQNTKDKAVQMGFRITRPDTRDFFEIRKKVDWQKSETVIYRGSIKGVSGFLTGLKYGRLVENIK